MLIVRPALITNYLKKEKYYTKWDQWFTTFMKTFQPFPS